MILNELKRVFEKRPQSWTERLEELKSQGKNNGGWGEYPKLLSAMDSAEDQFILKAQELTGAPVALSEERYSNDLNNDGSSLGVLYQVAEYPKHGLSGFWQVFYHLAGGQQHKCGMYCAKHELPEFVIQGK